MSVIGDFTVAAKDFALAHAFSTVPELTVEADRLASHGTTEVMPFLWVTGDDAGSLRKAVAADPSVSTATVADTADDGALLRVHWSGEFCRLVDEMVDHHAAIMRARATDGTWSLRLRFADEEMVSSFQTQFREAGAEFSVTSLRRPTEPRQSEFGLTPEQRDALAAAVHSGYFAIPRETSAEELGEQLGISANAASERVRRGTRTVIESALLLAEDDSEQ